jgi:hypothetical protein
MYEQEQFSGGGSTALPVDTHEEGLVASHRHNCSRNALNFAATGSSLSDPVMFPTLGVYPQRCVAVLTFGAGVCIHVALFWENYQSSGRASVNLRIMNDPATA